MAAPKKNRKILSSLLVEIPVYAGLVTVYFFLVLHFLGGWLKEIFDSNKLVYAIVALALIVGQGVVLETLTTWLLNFVRPRNG